MRRGTVYRRCSRCGRTVKARTCTGCGATSVSWSYRIDTTPAGARRRQQESRGGFATKAEATAALVARQESLSAGTYVPGHSLTVGEYLAAWLDALPTDGSVRPSSRESYELAVRRMVPLIGEYRLQELTASQLKTAYGQLRESGRARGVGGLSAKTVHNTHLVMHRALGDAVDDRLLARSPAEKSRNGRALITAPGQDEMHTWSGDELHTFLQAAAEHRLAPLWRLAAMTGMRRGELAGLKWRDLNLEAATVTVVRQLLKIGGHPTLVPHPKSDAGRRTLDLDPATVEVLRHHRASQARERLAWGPAYQSNDLVFCREDGTPLHPDTISKAFARVARDAGVPIIRLHDVRHTHATLMLAAGTPPHVVSRRLGHASPAFTLARYAHVLPGQQAMAVATVAAMVDGSASGS